MEFFFDVFNLLDYESGTVRGTSSPSDTLGREFDPGKRDFSH